MKKKCCDTHLTEQEANHLLLKNGISRTKIKAYVLLLLSKDKKPLSANEIHERIRPMNCDISSIWRTLKQFNEKGLTRELNLGENFFRYELKDHRKNQDHHHHHVRCRECGDIKDLGECDLSSFKKMISKLGFKNMEHSLEFTGLCSRCS